MMAAGLYPASTININTFNTVFIFIARQSHNKAVVSGPPTLLHKLYNNINNNNPKFVFTSAMFQGN